MLDEDQRGGRNEDLLLDVTHARIDGRAFGDAQQHGVLCRENGGVQFQIYCSAVEQFRIPPQNDNGAYAGQNLSKFREDCPASTSTLWLQL
jgi:hypothetical protein